MMFRWWCSADDVVVTISLIKQNTLKMAAESLQEVSCKILYRAWNISRSRLLRLHVVVENEHPGEPNAKDKTCWMSLGDACVFFIRRRNSWSVKHRTAITTQWGGSRWSVAIWGTSTCGVAGLSGSREEKKWLSWRLFGRWDVTSES